MKYIFPIMEENERFMIDVVSDTIEHAYQEAFKIMELDEKARLVLREDKEIIPTLMC